MIYFGKRYYNPRIGRFISQDPSGMVDGPNLYVYCNNDPINYADLWGLNQDKAEPWWEKLGRGEYYGTKFGTKATKLYAQQYLETGNWLWVVPGSISALWMPETYQATAWTLINTYFIGRNLYTQTVKVYKISGTVTTAGSETVGLGAIPGAVIGAVAGGTVTSIGVDAAEFALKVIG